LNITEIGTDELSCKYHHTNQMLSLNWMKLSYSIYKDEQLLASHVMMTVEKILLDG